MTRISDFLYIKLNNKNSNDRIEITTMSAIDGAGKKERLILFPGAKTIIKKASKHAKNATTSLSSQNFAFNFI
jgi:hypothetical protein